MSRFKGFTLIELLVVIAVIAVLMSIMMPALNQAKQQAKNAICLSNVHQLTLAITMYSNNSGGFFLEGLTGATGGWAWMERLRPYYSDDKILICPLTTKVRDEDYAAGGIEYMWNPKTVEDPLYGSYGLNGWLTNPERGQDKVFGRSAKNNWRTLSVKGGDRIPLILDCGIWDGWPLQTDEPPGYEKRPVEHGVLNNEMRRFCLNRHNGAVNGAFVDFSARRIGLKELWVLKWHRNYDTGGLLPDWPEWMRDFEEPY